MASLPRLHCLRILPILASLLLWCPVLPAAGEEARPYDPLRTMAALNQAAMSVSAIVNFDDRAVLDQEYRNIINNLNFGEVEADQELVDLYLALMDTLSKGTLREDERNSISQSYSRNSKKAMSSALSSVALSPDPASLFLGGILSVGSVFFDSKNRWTSTVLNSGRRNQDWRKAAGKTSTSCRKNCSRPRGN